MSRERDELSEEVLTALILLAGVLGWVLLFGVAWAAC